MSTDREWLREMFDGPARDVAALPEWARPVVTPPAGSPGTYGRNSTPPRHAWTPLPPDHGGRPRCKHCPQPRHEHEEKFRYVAPPATGRTFSAGTHMQNSA